MGRQLYMLRHGSVGHAGKYLGTTEVPVTPEGLQQVRNTGALLRRKRISRLFCSPQLRCGQTAAELNLGIPIETREELREINFGEWEGKTFAEIASGWPEHVAEWSRWSEEFTFPGGENIGAFIQRIERFKSDVQCLDEQNLLVVSHGGVIRHMICLFLNLSPSNYLLFAIQAGCFSSVALFDQGGVLQSLNSGGVDA